MSIFMLGGTVGYSLGPVLILLIVTQLGLGWSLLASLPAIGMAWLFHRQPSLAQEASRRVDESAASQTGLSVSRRALRFSVLFSIVWLRVTTSLTLITFLPIIQKVRGFSLVMAGSSNVVFMLCGAIGAVLGGYLAERMGRKNMILASFVLVIPAFFLFLLWKGPISFVILALLGLLLFLSEPSCIVLAQEMVPKQARMASGLIMGMAWGLAAAGVLGTGALADVLGIERALRFLLFLPAGALALSLFLPQEINSTP